MADSGNLYSFIYNQAINAQPALSFLNDQFTEVDAWRETTREYLRSLLLFSPEVVDLNPELVDHTEYDSFVQQKWYITSSPGERIPVILLLPRGMTGRTPAILALHDHGGRYFFGKKKLVAEDNEPEILAEYRNVLYGGTAIANELAQRGYIVAIIDSFYFGERRLDVPPPAEMQQEFLLAAEGSDQWLHLVDRVCASMEPVIAKSLFWAGATWPGIMAWDDRRTIDFLLTLPEVDPKRIGCIGFAMGGLRSALLGASDPRVKAVCIVGWMSTLADMLENEVSKHSWSDFIPGLPNILDWPDVASLHAPDPLLVMQGSQDEYFPLKGYQKAAEKLRAAYAKAGAPGNLDIGLFDQPHLFSQEMQTQAWAFFNNAFDWETNIR